MRCSNVLAYNYLLNVTYDRRNYSAIFLTLSGLTVTIKGRALRPLVDALRLHTCDFIQAFDAAEFIEPTDISQPFVQSIEVEVIRGKWCRQWPMPANRARCQARILAENFLDIFLRLG